MLKRSLSAFVCNGTSIIAGLKHCNIRSVEKQLFECASYTAICSYFKLPLKNWMVPIEDLENLKDENG